MEKQVFGEMNEKNVFTRPTMSFFEHKMQSFVNGISIQLSLHLDEYIFAYLIYIVEDILSVSSVRGYLCFFIVFVDMICDYPVVIWQVANCVWTMTS